jgi:phosphate starvation-inducible protein PhoH
MPSKKNKVSKVSKVNSYGLTLRQIKPLREPQRQVFESFFENHLLLHGYAGTGKTFIALYLGLKEVLEYNKYHKVIIVRSAVQGRDQGFMPGNEQEKMGYFEAPYRDNTNDLCGRGDAYDILKNRGCIEFMSTSFLRGITLNNSIVLVDEVQNMTFEELDGITTRVGNNSKLVLCGDFRQTDLKKEKERSGLINYMKILDMMKGIEHVEFQKEDIVRSEFVKQYIIAKAELDL